MANKIFLILIFVLTAVNAMSQKENPALREGNSLYEEEKFEEAADQYRLAISKNPANFKGPFNLADAQYKLEKYEESAAQFKSIAETVKDPAVKSRSYHNLGNSLLKQDKYKESIEAYKEALRINPKMQDTRHNLVYAMKKLQEQQQQQQQQQQQEQEQQEKEQQQDQEQKQDEQQQQQQEQPREMSREEAERLLEALQNKEKETQENREKQKVGQPVRIEKDW